MDGAASLDRLAGNILHPRFEPAQLEGFNSVTTLRQFEKDNSSSKPGNTLEPGDGWKRGKVTIRVPCTGHKQREDEAPEFTVDGICYRDAAEVVAKELADPESFKDIHIRPFEEWWRPTEASDPVRVYSEVYTSDAMLQLEKKLEETLKTTPAPRLETFIISALLYSDGTNLAQFGHASLWPVYLYIGNTSKYIRAQPNSFSAHHIAYLPTVRVSLPFRYLLDVSHVTTSYQIQSKNFTSNITTSTPTLRCSPTSSGNSSTAHCGWSSVADSQTRRRTVASPCVQMMS